MAIATIALAIGANAAMFSFVNGVLISPLPYPNPERVVRVLERRPDGGPNGISTLNFLDWKRDSTVFEYLAAQTGWGATLTGRDEPMQLRGALGASGPELRALVFRGGMRLALIGLAIGLGGALMLGRLLSSLLYGVSARDPLTLAVVTVTLAAIAAAACFLPARRATKVNPIVALRYQ